MNSHIVEMRSCTAGRTKTKLIISNGSERGDYVDCVEMQRSFASPHDGVQLMKTYYPSDPHWNNRTKISLAHPNPAATYAWDHDYDDYWPLDFDLSESTTERQLRQVKLIGADVHLTLTLDMSLTDEELVKLFAQLRTFGTVYLRINHEANGRWFRHHKLHSRKELNDFLVRCYRLIKCHTPNIKTVFSLSADVFVGDQVNSFVTKKLAHLDASELREALGAADYWSIDKYVTLNWGWPHTVPAASPNYFSGSVDTWWRLIEETYLLMICANGGVMKPLFLHEFNSDSDVVGETGQAAAISEVYQRLLQSDLPWLEGICFYQYCDEGGLGLRKGRAGQYSVTESMSAYGEALKEAAPEIQLEEAAWEQPHFSFSWHSSTAIKGLSLRLTEKIKRFTNRLDAAVYVVDQNRWKLLDKDETTAIEDSTVRLFIPPTLVGDQLRYVTTVHNIAARLADMFGAD